MSIWISDAKRVRSVAGLFALTVLTACGGIGVGRFQGPSTAGQFNGRTTVPQKTNIEVSSKNLVIQGPPGFCVDNEITELQPDNAFVLLGNCAVVSPNTRAPDPKVRALLTATISGTGQGQNRISDAVPEMDKFFRSEEGRTALSRASDPTSVQVLDTFRQDDTFYIRASDNSIGLVPGAADEYWRAYFDMNEQIVSVSVIGFKDQPLAPEVSLSTLQEFANVLKVSNGVAPGPTPEPIPVTQTPIEQNEYENVDEDDEIFVADAPHQPHRADPIRTLYTIGLLRRLFR